MNARQDTGSIRDAAGRGDLDSAIAGVRGLPVGHPERGSLAAGLAIGLLQTTALTDPQRLRQLGELLDIADSDPPPWPQWRSVRARARVMALMGSAADSSLADPSAAIRQLDELATEFGDSPAERMLLDTARSMFDFLRAFQTGDEAGHIVARPQVERMRAFAAHDSRAALIADFMADALDLMTLRQQGGDVVAAIDRLREKAALLDPATGMSRVVEETVAMMGPIRGVVSDPAANGRVAAQVSPEQLAAIEKLTATGLDPVMGHIAAGIALMKENEETDLGRLGAAIDHFRAAVDLVPPGHPQRTFATLSLAMGLNRRCELTNDLTDLDTVVALAHEAREQFGGPQHPQWAMASDLLSYARRRLGDPEAREFAFDSLRNTAWRVLLQGDAMAARFVAQNAARDGIAAAQECYADGHIADAVRALDAGRGLMLFAATEFHDVVPRLLAAGKTDLAERWERAAGPDPDRTGLRGEVLAVLAEQTGLLDPPDLDEIREALVALDADALVYLVPNDSYGGMAVIAPARGQASFMALPNLVVDQDVDVERYFKALANRDIEQAGRVDQASQPPEASPNRDLEWADQQDEDLAGSLDTLCDWAWRAAVGPLIERYLGSLPEPASGRPRRLFLVPMGELALIPWQAARRGDGRYAVELAAISQTASARMLCRSASLAPVPPSPVGLIVGDPDTSRAAFALESARAEAYAIYRSFYRGARYVGTRPDGTIARSGAGTGDEVRDWLTTASPGAGSMLHLACHGVIKADATTNTAYLLLADGDKVTAEEIVRLMASAPDRAIGLAVLAACRTGRSIYGYDEAYSLGTAFLAGGVRSVLSTQWAVPDRDTSVLMFMFHHYLMVQRLPAWAALRQAQLWMLDPVREPPPTMPPQLRRQLAGQDPARIAAWAGFVHWGQ